MEHQSSGSMSVVQNNHNMTPQRLLMGIGYLLASFGFLISASKFYPDSILSRTPFYFLNGMGAAYLTFKLWGKLTVRPKFGVSPIAIPFWIVVVIGTAQLGIIALELAARYWR